MTIPISAHTLITKRADLDARFAGYREEVPARVEADDDLVAFAFGSPDEAERWAARLRELGISDVAFGGSSCDWLETHGAEASLRGRPFGRFDLLSRSSSGLHYVRDRTGGVMRVLTEEELADFTSPRPCPECAEQFGCEHYNCAGESLLAESELFEAVPHEWLDFARENGVSREDLTRLASIERNEEGYRVREGVSADMRMLELVLLLNEQ